LSQLDLHRKVPCSRQTDAFGQAAAIVQSHLELRQQTLGRLNVICVDSCLYSQARCQGCGLMAVVKVLLSRRTHFELIKQLDTLLIRHRTVRSVKKWCCSTALQKHQIRLLQDRCQGTRSRDVQLAHARARGCQAIASRVCAPA
jgi:hypothetical protein